MQQMTLSIKFFTGSHVSSTKNWMIKEIQWAIYRRNTRNCGQCCPWVTTKKATKFLSVKFPLKIPKFQIQYDHQDFRHSWILHNNVHQQCSPTMLQNGLLVTVAPNFWKKKNRNVNRTECLSHHVFTRLWGRKMAHITKVHSLYLEPPSIASFTCCHHATNKWIKKTFSEV